MAPDKEKHKMEEDYEALSARDQLRYKLFEAIHNDDVPMATELLNDLDVDIDFNDEV